MARGNGKAEVDTNLKDRAILDAEHELPSGEGSDDTARAQTDTKPESDELQRLKAERDKLLYRVAELDNARKRAVKEQQDYKDYALADTLRTLLPILDSFERALQVSAGEKSEFHDGVELIYKQLQDALGKVGLKPISAKGTQFDPHQHEAIEMVDTEEVRDHEVLDELQKGYRLKERLLRPAMVRVARNSKH
jgi:molecular chaperone GrpE